MYQLFEICPTVPPFLWRTVAGRDRSFTVIFATAGKQGEREQNSRPFAQLKKPEGCTTECLSSNTSFYPSGICHVLMQIENFCLIVNRSGDSRKESVVQQGPETERVAH